MEVNGGANAPGLAGSDGVGWTMESAILAEDDEMSSEVAPSALCICDTTFLLGWWEW